MITVVKRPRMKRIGGPDVSTGLRRHFPKVSPQPVQGMKQVHTTVIMRGEVMVKRRHGTVFWLVRQ